MSIKAKPLVGADGRVYFRYSLGAVYELTPKYAQPFVYRIIACEYDKDTEYYRIESAGREIYSRYTVKTLEEILNRLPCTQIEEGELVELPLLTEEVEVYFNARRKEVNKENAAANKKLKGTEYYKNVSVIKTLSETLQLLKANGDDVRAAELEKKLAELRAAQDKILSDNAIDYKILTKAADCKLCGDSGFVDGKICACAKAQAEKIKTFNAGLRLNANN